MSAPNPFPQPRQDRPIFFWLLLAVAGTALLSAGSFVLYMTLMRNSEPGKHAFALAEKDPRVIAAIGSPVRTGWRFHGDLSVSNDRGRCDFYLPLRGPRGTASVHVVGTKDGGVWAYETLDVTTAKDKTFSLLQDQ